MGGYCIIARLSPSQRWVVAVVRPARLVLQAQRPRSDAWPFPVRAVPRRAVRIALMRKTLRAHGTPLLAKQCFQATNALPMMTAARANASK